MVYRVGLGSRCGVQASTGRVPKGQGAQTGEAGGRMEAPSTTTATQASLPPAHQWPTAPAGQRDQLLLLQVVPGRMVPREVARCTRLPPAGLCAVLRRLQGAPRHLGGAPGRAGRSWQLHRAHAPGCTALHRAPGRGERGGRGAMCLGERSAKRLGQQCGMSLAA
jgi:hypothetical protein